MSKVVNQHGLNREIPSEVKRIVRQRDGFGCIVCGGAIVDYEHFDPEFVDAKFHDPNGIILLCPTHHRKKGGLLSSSVIQQRRSNPKTKEQGFSREAFEFGSNHVKLQIGALIFEDVRHAIVIDIDPIFSVLPPEQPGGPYRINARMTDRFGAEILRIVDNEMQSPISNWDARISASKVEILRGRRDVVLRLRTDAPDTLFVEHLEMVHRGHTISVRNGKPAMFQTPTKSSLSLHGVQLRGFEVGLWSINESIGFGGDYASVVAKSIASFAPLGFVDGQTVPRHPIS